MFIKINRPRAVQRNALYRGSVWRGIAFTRAGKSGDVAGLRIHPPNAMFTDVTNIQVSGWPKLNTVRPVHRGFRGQTAIATESGFAVACKGADAAGFRIHFTHEMILHFHKLEVARGIDSDFIGSINLACVAGPPSPM